MINGLAITRFQDKIVDFCGTESIRELQKLFGGEIVTFCEKNPEEGAVADTLTCVKIPLFHNSLFSV
jgi:hypothetical protein